MFVFKCQGRLFDVFCLLLHRSFFFLWCYLGLREAAASYTHPSGVHAPLSLSYTALWSRGSPHGLLRTQSDISVSKFLFLSFLFSVIFTVAGRACAPHSPGLLPPLLLLSIPLSGVAVHLTVYYAPRATYRYFAPPPLLRIFGSLRDNPEFTTHFILLPRVPHAAGGGW